MTNPFASLGLDPAASLSDDEVRAAWRRIAEATHPDRADGGDAQRFARAAAAYTELRTASGRGEARAAQADAALAGSGPGRPPRTGAFRPLAFRPLAFRPLAFRPLAFRPRAFRPLAFRPRAFPPRAIGPRAIGPRAIGPRAIGPRAIGPRAIGPRAIGPRAVRPGAFRGRTGRLSGGRPGRLALRIVIAAGASAAALLAAGPGPAGPALVTGAATWLLLTARHDLGPR